MSRFLLKSVSLSLGLCVGVLFTNLDASEVQANETQAVSPHERAQEVTRQKKTQAVTREKKAQWDAMLTPAPKRAPVVEVKELPAKQVAMLFGKPVVSNNPRAASAEIVSGLLKAYALERGITVSDAELALYAARVAEVRKRWEKQQVGYIKELKEALASGTLSEEQSELARHRIEGIERRALNPTKMSAEEQMRTLEQVTRPFLLQQKTLQQLYRDYGGRVVFQQMGPEPLDAVRDFLKAEQAKGSFSFEDADTESAFWEYSTTEPPAWTVIKDEKEIDRMMNTPWWLEPLPPEGAE